jgi:hypothetical protein
VPVPFAIPQDHRGEYVLVATHYFRRTAPTSRRWFHLGTRERYELWQADGVSASLTIRELDELLDARRFPADFWVAVHAADAAFDEGDRESWIKSGTGRRVSDPGQSAE